jgi:hypothetical protein
MNTAAEVLLIIVSVVLSIFLILLIFLLVQIIRLVKSLREVAAKAEKVVTSAQSIGKIFGRASGPAGLIQFFRVVLETVSEHKHKGEK